MRVMELKRTAAAIFATGAIAIAAAVPAAAQDTTSEPLSGYGTVEELCAWAYATPDMAPAADESPAVDMGEETTADGWASVDAALVRELCDRAGLTADVAGGDTSTEVDPSPGMSPGVEDDASEGKPVPDQAARAKRDGFPQSRARHPLVAVWARGAATRYGLPSYRKWKGRVDVRGLVPNQGSVAKESST